MFRAVGRLVGELRGLVLALLTQLLGDAAHVVAVEPT